MEGDNVTNQFRALGRITKNQENRLREMKVRENTVTIPN